MIAMLKLFFQLRELHFSDLMDVYTEGNSENAEVLYPYYDANFGILRAEQDFYQYLHDVFFRTEGAFYAVWIEGKTYVSALRLEPYRDGLLLEALETHPSYRNRGYAKRLISCVLDYLRSNGCKCVYSHISKLNTPSLRTHSACGFKKIADHAVNIDGSVTAYACTMVHVFEAMDKEKDIDKK